MKGAKKDMIVMHPLPRVGEISPEARRLLRDTTFTISAVAEETGFANAQRLYVAFRKVQGATPGAYRRSYRG